MPTKIDEMFVELSAKTDKLLKGFEESKKASVATSKKIESSFVNLKNPISSVGSALKGMLGPLIAVGGAAGIGMLAKNSIDAADRMAKVSDNIGIQTDLLQELSFAASQTGVSQNDLEASLMRFNRRLAEAASGAGEFAKGYETLGIKVTDSNGRVRDAETVLFEVADKIKDLGNESKQASVLFKLFGDSGFRLVNLFKNGSPELIKYRQQAHELGIVLDESMLRNAEKAKDQFDVLSRVLSSQFSKVLLDLAPLITKVAGGLTVAISATGQFIQKVTGLGAAAPSVAELKSKIAELNEEIEKQETRAKKYEAIPQLRLVAQAAREEIVRLQSEISGLQNQISDEEKKKGGKEDRAPAGGIDEETLRKQEELRIAATEKEIADLQAKNELMRAIDEEHYAQLIKMNEDKLSAIQKSENENSVIYLKLRKRELDKERTLNQQKVGAVRDTFSNLTALGRLHNKTAFDIAKAAGIATATIDGILAVQKALSSAPPPFNFILAASVGVKTAANVAAISAQQFKKGGEVPGVGFGDKVPILAEPKENVIDRSLSAALKQNLTGGNGSIVQAIQGQTRVMMQLLGSQRAPVVIIGDEQVFNAVNREIEQGRRFAA